jgi:carboxyl-terminal processing protease
MNTRIDLIKRHQVAADNSKASTCWSFSAVRLMLCGILLALMMTACQSVNQEYLKNFEVVWQVVNDTFPDPTFGGVDWKAVHDRYQPLIGAAKSDEEFFLTLNRMLWELNASHAVVMPNKLMFNLDRAFAEGGIGIDVRLIDDEVVITLVKPLSPADQAGLRPGDILRRVDGATIQQIEEEGKVFQMPPYNDRADAANRAMNVLISTYGQPGTQISIVYQDDRGEHQVDLVRAPREGKSVLIEGVPPGFLEVESKQLANDIGYVRFNRFDPALLDRLLAAVDEQTDAAGLIIDIRGNDGGFFGVRKALLEKLVRERMLFVRQESRRGADEIYLEPAAKVYDGPVVVLVDEFCASASEEFAGGLQAIGRAVIVGNRTPGKVLIADTKQLPNGATFVYPVAVTRLANGTVLEGRGVMPDIEVALDRALLLQGRDSQLEAAINYLEQK